jgi:hypothetical protein
LVLLSALAEILSCHPKGISEYDLLRILQQAAYELFDRNALSLSADFSDPLCIV